MKRIPAWRGWRWLVIAWAVSAVLSAWAEDDEGNNDGPARFHDVKGWRGTLVARARVNPAALSQFENLMVGRGKGAEMTYDFSAYQVIEFELTEYESDPSVWTGKVTRSQYSGDYRYFLHMPDNYANDQTWWKGYGDHEGSYSVAGPLDFGDDPVAKLEFHRQRGWSVHLATGRGKATEHKRWYQYVPPESEQDPEHDLIIGESTTMEEEHEISIAALNGTETHPYPEKGLALVASDSGREGSSPAGGSAGISPSVLWDYTVSLEPIGMEELRLVIDEPAQYPTWRPETTPDAAAGPALDVTVHLETAQGREPKVRVQKFVWELIGTSKEPGVAMNYPINAKDHRFDLDLGAEGEFFVLRDKNQKMERAVREGFTDKAKVVPYDWGGWSTLQVTAYLTDGRPVIGKLKGQSDAGLRVPKRDANSYIADGWKKTTGAGGADNADDENAPLGDGSKGDGLTLYEEYRGWYEDGTHIEGDSKTKDFFVQVKRAGFALPGIADFQKLTGLITHYRFTESEFPRSRIMNLNRSRGPRVTSQHGVIVQVKAGQSGVSKSVGGPGSPKNVKSVDLADDLADSSDSYVAVTVAHELGHSVNLWHHGDADYQVVWAVREGKLYEGKNGDLVGEILVVNEQRQNLTPSIINLVLDVQADGQAEVEAGLGRRSFFTARMAVDQGQHSGVENCIMRYDDAKTYKDRRQPSVRFWHFTEPVGAGLCQTSVGSGVNEEGRKPQSRYGPAFAGRGDCFHQIHVTDAIPAPWRFKDPRPPNP